MQSQQEIQAVIFDCDGTLVDSEVISLHVLVDLVAEFGVRIPHEEAMDRYAGNELPIVFADIEERMQSKLPDDFLDTFRDHQIATLKKELKPLEGVEPLLRDMTLPYCVASNAPLNKVGVCLKTSGLLKYFPEDRIFSAYQIEIWKPEPDLFLMCADALDVPAANCAVVEDSIFGVKAGLAAGMQVFAYDRTSDFRANTRTSDGCSNWPN